MTDLGRTVRDDQPGPRRPATPSRGATSIRGTGGRARGKARLATLAALGAVGVVGLLGACTSAGDEDASDVQGTEPLEAVTTTTDPPSCAEVDADGWPSETCFAERAAQALKSLRSEELTSLPATALDARVESLCDAASGVSGSRQTRPALLSELIDEPDWSPVALAELSSLARHTCPERFVEIDILPTLIQPVLIAYRVEGVQAATVDWVTAAGSIITESVAADWSGEVRLEEPVDVRVDVTFDGGTARTCTILLDGEEIVTAELPDTAEIPQLRCSLSAAELEFGALQRQGGKGDGDN